VARRSAGARPQGRRRSGGEHAFTFAEARRWRRIRERAVKRPGPPFGSGPGSDTKLSDAGERTLTRSDAGRASRSSLSQPNPTAERSGNSVELLIYLEARGQGRFDAFLANSPIVTASTQPICDAAGALHRLRIREDRGGPRFGKWDPFLLLRARARKGRIDGKAGHGADEKNASRTPPGAAKSHSPAPVAQNSAVSDPGRDNA
jgi:hypothetical protein